MHAFPNFFFMYRLGKLACPRVNDDQKSGVDDQKFNSSRPHDDWSFGRLRSKIMFNFPHFSTASLVCIHYILEDN